MGRRREYDVLRTLACLAVVYLHVAAPALRQFEDMAVWHVSNVVTSLATAAVPVFFLMSGALALGSAKTADLGDLLKRRLWRVLVPFAVWTCIMLGYYLWRDGAEVAWRAAKDVLRVPVTTPYWFLYAFVPITLLSPVLKKLADGLEEKDWNYLLLLWLVFTILPHTVREFLPETLAARLQWYPAYSLTYLGGMLGYYLLGYRLSTVRCRARPWQLAAAAVVLTAIIAGGTWYNYLRLGVYSEQYKSYLALPVVVLAACIFLLARVWFEAHPKRGGGRVWRAVAGASFGVYLSHPLLMDVIRRLLSGEVLITLDSLGIQLGFFALVAGASIALSYAVGRIPCIGYALTGTRKKSK